MNIITSGGVNGCSGSITGGGCRTGCGCVTGRGGVTGGRGLAGGGVIIITDPGVREPYTGTYML